MIYMKRGGASVCVIRHPIKNQKTYQIKVGELKDHKQAMIP